MKRAAPHPERDAHRKPWYAVVTHGSTLGNHRAGRRVTQDLRIACARAEALRGNVAIVRVIECQTRRLAREAQISDNYPVVWP